MSDGRAATPSLGWLRSARVEHDAVRRWFLRAAPLLFALVALSAFKASPHPGLAGRGLAVSTALTGFVAGLVAARVALQRSNAFAAIAFVLLVTSSVVLMWIQPDGPGSVGVLLGVLFVSRRLPTRVAVPVAVVAFVVLAVISATTGKGAGVALLALLGGFVGMTALSNRLAEANEQAERLLVELEQSRAAEARAVGLAERQRLAREMHDVLAHSLSGLMLQLEGARMLAAGDPTDPRLALVIDRAHHLARSGLDEARRAIGTLRGDELLPGPERVAALAAQFERDRGIPCRFSVSGEEHELGSEARLALYRVAQEALTNIAKHARPHRVELRLSYDPGGTRLVVEDFALAAASPAPAALPPVSVANSPVSAALGPVPAAVPAAPGAEAGSASGSGYGLTGMRERAELLGGTLTAGTTATGFRLELDVPA